MYRALPCKACLPKISSCNRQLVDSAETSLPRTLRWNSSRRFCKDKRPMAQPLRLASSPDPDLQKACNPNSDFEVGIWPMHSNDTTYRFRGDLPHIRKLPKTPVNVSGLSDDSSLHKSERSTTLCSPTSTGGKNLKARTHERIGPARFHERRAHGSNRLIH